MSGQGDCSTLRRRQGCEEERLISRVGRGTCAEALGAAGEEGSEPGPRERRVLLPSG